MSDFIRVDKTVPVKTFLHYSDPTARQERTVFGSPRSGLFYNYSDRLIGESWDDGCKLANKSQFPPKSAGWYEIVLNHIHGSTDVNLQHIILGCNMSNGYSYLIFGYTYTSTNEKY